MTSYTPLQEKRCISHKKRIFGKRIAAYLQKLSTRGVQCVGNMRDFLMIKQVV